MRLLGLQSHPLVASEDVVRLRLPHLPNLGWGGGNGWREAHGEKEEREAGGEDVIVVVVGGGTHRERHQTLQLCLRIAQLG